MKAFLFSLLFLTRLMLTAKAGTYVVSGKAGPWIQQQNPAFEYGVHDQQAPTVVPVQIGQTVTFSGATGSVSAGSGAFCGPDGYLNPAGPFGAWVPANGKPGSSGSRFPSFYMAPYWNINLMSLVGAFTDDNGVIKGNPFEIGNTSLTLTVPAGATRVQLGLNDDIFGDNTGSISISVVTAPIPPISFHRLAEIADTTNPDAGIDAPIEPTIDLERLWRLPEVTSGLVTDDVTPLVIRISRPGETSVNLTFENWNGGTIAGGPNLRVLSGGVWTAGTQVPLGLDGTGYAMIDGLSPAQLSIAALSGIISADLVVSGIPPQERKAVQFRKPPIVFVHGVASNRDTWGSDFLLTFYNKKRPYILINYGDIEVQDGSLRACLDPLQTLAQSLDTKLNTAVPITGAGQDESWAMTRYDVVGHSQGGVLLRMLCIDRDSPSRYWIGQQYFRNESNFNRGRFRRIVTIGSPHNGNVLTTYMLELKRKHKETGDLPLLGTLLLSALDERKVLHGKFDPFGWQIRAINSPKFATDRQAPFHLIATLVNQGRPPNSADTIRAYRAILLNRPVGNLILPSGSDGIVEPESALAGNFGQHLNGESWLDQDAPHLATSAWGSQYVIPFYGVLDEYAQTQNEALGGRIGNLLDGPRTNFDSFERPTLRPMAQESAVKVAVPDVRQEQIVPDTLAPKSIVAVGAPVLAASSTFQYRIDAPTTDIVPDTLSWSFKIFGGNNVDPAGITLIQDATDSRKVTVNISDTILGDVVLTASYASTDGALVIGSPTVVLSRPPLAALTGISIAPFGGTLAWGTSTTLDLSRIYADGTVLRAYVPPSPNLTVVSSDSDVVRVDAGLAITAVFPGEATLTVTLDGFQAQVTAIVEGAPPIVARDNAVCPGFQPIRIFVLANDASFIGYGLSIESITQPQFGSVAIDGNQILYTPTAQARAAGKDQFTYTASDGWASNQATVTVELPPLPGDVDLSFGQGGKTTTAIGSGWDQANGVTLQNDGKIVAAGMSQNGSNYDFAVARYNADGSLDNSFSTTGKVTTPVGVGSSQGNSVVIQSNGKIVIAGSAFVAFDNDFALVRYNTNGSLDTSFNGTGKVTTPIGSGQDFGQSVAIQNDGKIIVAGSSHNGSNYDFAVARYNASGSLDTTFNGTGKVTTAFGSSDDFGSSLAVQADGKIVVAGYSWNGSKWNFALVRYNPNGSLDTGFTGTGKVTTTIGGGHDQAYGVAIQSGGKIVVAGYSHNGNDYDIAVARYNANGTLDATFNGTGKVTTPIGTGDDRGSSVALHQDGDGKIVVAGFSHNGSNQDFALVCYNANGSLDTTFNGTGKITTAVGDGDDYGQCVAVQADRKIVVAGYSSNGGSTDFAVVRYRGEFYGPDISVEQPVGTSLTDGRASVGFGNVMPGNHADLTFLVKNPGTEALTGLGVTIDGPNSAEFTIVAGPTSPVPPAGSTTFTIHYAPATAGAKTAAIHLANNVGGSKSPFDITIGDIGNTPPVLIMPASPLLAEATGPSGETINFNVGVDDAEDGVFPISVSPVSGSTFMLGDTPVLVSATDSTGATTVGSFIVRVQDTTPPVLSGGGSFGYEATSAAGAVVTFTGFGLGAFDLVDGAIVPVCNPPSGSTFPIGTTTVGCTATDSHGNSASLSFTVTITDTTAPLIAINGVNPATVNAGSYYHDAGATALDAVSGNVAVTASSTLNPNIVGTYAIIYSATDASGHLATATRVVSVIPALGPSSLDASFGNGGKVLTPIGTGDDQGRCVAIASDGKIVVAGNSYNGSNDDFALVRYNAGGTLDTTFNGTGKVTTDIGTSTDNANSVAIQSDGKIVVAGWAIVGIQHFAVVRYNANGTLDTTFNGTGKVTTTFGTSFDSAYGVAIQSNGKIVVAGRSRIGTNDDIAVVRYNANGSLDTSFNGTGKVTTSIGSGDDFAQSVAMQGDGKIVVAGLSFNGTKYDFAVVRYNTNGSLDTTLNGNGKVTTGFGAIHEEARSVALQSDGKIVVAGISYTPSVAFALARYNADGSLDTTFNSSGKVTTAVGGNDGARSVAIQGDGKLVVVGSSDFDFAVMRYNSNGSLDTDFNGTGKVTTDINNIFSVGYGAALQGDGKIVVAGFGYPPSGVNKDFALVRYNGGNATPEIAVEQPANANLEDGVASVAFGGVLPGTSTSLIFTVKNPGGANLTGMVITVDGPDSANFTVTADPTVPVLPNGDTSFTVRFSPITAGAKTAALHIASNDIDETPFDIALTGTGLTRQGGWRQQYFGNPANSGAGADLNDYDRDGLVNFIEFATASNPTTFSGPIGAVARIGGNLQFTYTRSKAAVSDGMTFAVEWSDTLGSTSWSATGVSETLSDQGDTELVTVTLPAGLNAHRFVHLRVTRP